MHTGKLVFAQLMDHLPLHTFRRCVEKYAGRYVRSNSSKSSGLKSRPWSCPYATVA